MDAQTNSGGGISTVLVATGRAAGGAVVWCTLGLTVAALISALAIFVWAIYIFAVAWPSAAILGSGQGLWLFVERRNWSNSKQQTRFGLFSGALLGLLGFVPSYIQTGILPPHGWWSIAIFLSAAFFGGMAAGGVNARLFPVSPQPDLSSHRVRRFVVAVLLLLGGGLLEYSLYWPSLVRKLPLARLSESAVVNLTAGNARGSAWSGCFQYLGDYFWSSGVVGSEGGLAYVQQNDGYLEISLGGSKPHLTGGANSDGRFWAGAQSTVSREDTLRTLLKGKFVDKDHLEYSLRRTYVKGGSFGDTIRTDGTAGRCREP